MFVVTPAARVRLAAKLTHQKATDDEAMRFTRREGGWRLRLDRARPGDLTFTLEGRSLLLLDAAVSEAMADMKLGVRSTKAGFRLKLRRIKRRSGSDGTSSTPAQ